MIRDLAFAAALFVIGSAAAGEADWKARFEAIDNARLQSSTMDDHQKAMAQFAALAADLEIALKEELAKSKESAATATAAYWLASTYLYLGREPQAAVLLRIAMEIRVKLFGENSAPVAEVWDKAAWLGNDPERTLGALNKALAIREKLYGRESREVAANLRDIGMNRLTSTRYDESEAVYTRALAIMEKVGGPGSLDVVEPLSDLGWLYVISRRPEQAVPVYKRALAVTEKSVSGDDDRTAKALENLAYAYAEMHVYGEAEALYLRAIPMREKLHGPKSMLTITPMARLRDIYIVQDRTIDSWKLGRKIEAAQE